MNKMPRLIGRVVLTVLMLFLSGCFYDKDIPEAPSDNISYELEIQPIFSSHCTSCHPPLISSPDLTTGNSYNSITNGVYIIPNDLDASLLYQRLLGNPSIMPPSGSLSASEINLVGSWIKQGALNN